jgi:hypothetical protein
VISSLDQTSFCDELTVTLTGYSSFDEYDRQLDLIALSEGWNDATKTAIEAWSDGYMINASLELGV